MADTLPKIALITGAAQRIGRAFALGLAKAGWRVGVHYRKSEAEAAALIALIKTQGGQATAFQADLETPTACTNLLAAVNKTLGPISLLVNNASLFEPDDIHTLTQASFQRHWQVNLQAPLWLIQAFAAQSPKASPPKTSANIVNMLDQRVWAPAPDFLSYTLSKSALWTTTQIMAQALAPAIRVNAIGPGPSLPSARQSDVHFAKQQRATPLQRGAAPEELFAALRFILDSPALTGQMLALDGGQHLQGAQRAE